MADAAPTSDFDAQAWSQQYDQEQAAAKSQELLPKQEAPHPFQAVSNWVSSLPSRINSAVLDQAVPAVESVYNSKLGRAGRDIVAGATTGVKNVADAAYSFARSASVNFHDNPALRTITGEAAPVAPPESPIWTHAKAAVQDFTDAVKVKDPGIADDLIQYTAQVAPSYLLAGRLLGGLHGVANAVASGIPADAAAIDPHAPRFADILGVLKQTDGKIGQALRAAGPYGLNAYINYLGSNANETEAQGRWKNALDGILPNFIGTELLHAAGITVKQGYAGLRYMVDNGVASAGDLGAKSAASQRGGLAAARVDPADEIATEQARKDMAKAAANPNGERPPLRTGEDPAQPIYEGQVKQDMAQDRMTRMMKLLHSQQHTDAGGVQHSADGDVHTVTSDNGLTVSMRRPFGLQVIDTQTFDGAQGRGEGTARLEKMSAEAEKQGMPLVSDTQVSGGAAKVYDKLEKRGYRVTRNPAEPDGSGNLISTTTRPVFEVRPPAEKGK